jgi:competence protein ComEC
LILAERKQNNKNGGAKGANSRISSGAAKGSPNSRAKSAPSSRTKTASRKNAPKKPGKVNGVAVLIIIIAVFFGFGTYLERQSEAAEGVTAKAAATANSGVLEVSFIDVGQGDSTLITDGAHSILIDAGEVEYADTVIEFIESKGIKKLDLVIATHPHSDHLGGLPEVLEKIKTDEIIIPKIPDDKTPTTKIYETFLDTADAQNITLRETFAGDSFEIGDIHFTVLSPKTDADYDDLNDYSTVVLIAYGDTRWLFTGDAEKPAEKDLLASGVNLSADVLSVGHHGSGNSSTVDFLEAVEPQIAVISCGRDNEYGHPSAEALSRLALYTDRIYRTDKDGTITLITNGETIAINNLADTESEQNGYSGKNRK